MNAPIAVQFWIFVLSGIIVSWVPLLAGFLIRHRKLIKHIDKLTADQTGDIKNLTAQQTVAIKNLTDAQTAELLASRAAPSRSDSPPGQYHEHDRHDADPGS